EEGNPVMETSVDEMGMPLIDEFGQPVMQPKQQVIPMTREAEFDLTLNIGDGLPSDKTFMYQTMLDLSGKIVEGRPVISWTELRKFLRDYIGMNLGNDDEVAGPLMPGMPGLPPMGAPPLQGLPGGITNAG